MTSEPVLVIYNSKTSSYSHTLMRDWPTIEPVLKSTYPNLRIRILIQENCWSKFDHTTVPPDMDRYRAWTPMIILVPGNVWDRAMENLDTKIPIQEGVQIFNGYWGADKLQFKREYDIRKAEDYVRWLDKSFKEIMG